MQQRAAVVSMRGSRAIPAAGGGGPATARRARWLLTFAAVVLALAPSCVSKPTMKLAYARVTTAGPQGIGIDVWLQVTNDNSFDVRVRNVRVSVVMAGHIALPPMAYSPNQWLPADGTTLVRAPVIVPWTVVPQLLAETARSPSIPYRVRGEADVTAVRSLGIESDRHPVDEKGSIPRAAIFDAARAASPVPIPW